MDRTPQSLRLLLRQRRFSALAAGSLAIAIALNTTMYAVLDTLLHPVVRMHQPERLYRIGFRGDFPRLGQQRRLTAQMYVDGLTSLRSFKAQTASFTNYSSLGGANLVQLGDFTYEARVLNVSANYFAVVGNQPLAGRLLSSADVNVEPRPIVVGERLWKQLFPERPSFDTATITLGEEPRVIVGVLSRESDFPGASTDVWQLTPASLTFLRPVNLVRLTDGATLQQASAELRVLARRFAAITGEKPGWPWFDVQPAMGAPFHFQRFHVALMGAVVAVLLVACVNLAGLQMARGLSRATELATRAAIGASRRQILGQLLLESTWLAAGGLLLGVLLTLWGIRVVAASVPPSLSGFIMEPRVSWRLFGFASLAAAASLAVAGLLPAIRLSHVRISAVMKAGAGTGVTRRARRQYGGLVVIQLSLALTLLAGAALLLRAAASLYNLDVPEQLDRTLFGSIQVQPPAAPASLLVGAMNFPNGSRPRDQRVAADAANAIVHRLRALPGVENAAASFRRHPAGLTISIADPGGTPREIVTGQTWTYDAVTSEYPRVTGFSILSGRDFQDGEYAEPLVIVDAQTARLLWPGQSAVGKRLKMGRDSSRAAWLEVIGVASFVNLRPYQRANQEERLAARMGSVFVLNGSDTSTIGTGTNMDVAVRAGSANEIQKLPNRVRAAVRDRAGGIRLGYLETWRRITGLDISRERQNFVAALFTVFAVLALGVAALGVYSLVSHSVTRRSREIGVRLALGASEGDIRRTVLQEGNVLALSGIALGLVIASQTAGLLQAFLRSDDDRYNSPLFAAVALVLFGAAFIASYVPARRAMRIDPTEALRSE